MNIIQKIAVVGGTGKSGTYLVRELLKRNFPVRLLVRNPDFHSFDNALIEPVTGDVGNRADVFRLLEGASAVVSMLGQRGNQASIFSHATTNILAAMSHLRIHRYIVTTGLNVDCAGDDKKLKTLTATEWMKKNYPLTTFDKQIEYDLLLSSRVNWTLVRLPLIILTDERKAVHVNLEDCPGENIGAADLADFAVRQLSDDSLSLKAPFIYH